VEAEDGFAPPAQEPMKLPRH